MWARNMELSLGLWLLLSPFILRHGSTGTSLWSPQFLWSHDLAVGALVVSLSIACYARALRRAHLLLLALAAWLMGLGWWSAWQVDWAHVEAAYQNWLLVGLLLALFAIVPSEASQPPVAWRARSPFPPEDPTGVRFASDSNTTPATAPPPTSTRQRRSDRPDSR